jgi:hypothetical protein
MLGLDYGVGTVDPAKLGAFAVEPERGIDRFSVSYSRLFAGGEDGPDVEEGEDVFEGGTVPHFVRKTTDIAHKPVFFPCRIAFFLNSKNTITHEYNVDAILWVSRGYNWHDHGAL